MQNEKTVPTTTQEEFRGLCAKHGCGSDAEFLRDALHRMGVVFYRKDLFGERIVVDQLWVLDKVYAVFDRAKVGFRREVRDKGGKFRDTDLQRFFWGSDTPADQRTYLVFMEQCGICFRSSPEGHHMLEYEGLYTAPDLLPGWEEGPSKEFAWWPGKCDAAATATYTLLHDGIARGFLSKIGGVAGNRVDYWRYGCHFHDSATKSEALVRMDGNAIRLEARDGEAERLLQTLAEILLSLPTGLPPEIVWDGHRGPSDAQPEDAPPERRLAPVRRPRLERLGIPVLGRSVQLTAFYLVGCAFRSDRRSFKSIAAEFADRDLKGLLPDKIATSERGIANLLIMLAREVFADHLGMGRDALKLYEVAGQIAGNSCVLTADGVTAWEDTRDYLERHGIKPDWWLPMLF